jgi:hypothetical protein
VVVAHSAPNVPGSWKQDWIASLRDFLRLHFPAGSTLSQPKFIFSEDSTTYANLWKKEVPDLKSDSREK